MKTIIVLLLFTLQLCYLPLQAQLQLDVKEVSANENVTMYVGLLDTIGSDYLVLTRYKNSIEKINSKHGITLIDKNSNIIREFDVLFQGEDLDVPQLTLIRKNGDSVFVAGTVYKPAEMILYERPFLAAFSLSTGKLLKLYLLSEDEYVQNLLTQYSFFHTFSHLAFDARKILYLGVRHFRNEKKFRLRGLYHSALDNSVVDSMIDAPLDIPEGFEVKDNLFGYGLVRNKNIVVSLEIWQESKKGIIVFCLDSAGNKLWDKIIMPKEGFKSSSLNNYRNINIVQDSLIFVYQAINTINFSDEDQIFMSALSADGDLMWQQNIPPISRYGQNIWSIRYSPEQKEIYILGTYNRFSNAPTTIPRTMYVLLALKTENGEYAYKEVEEGNWLNFGSFQDVFQKEPNTYFLFGEKNTGSSIRRPLLAILTRKPVSITEETKSGGVTLYPNPAKETIAIGVAPEFVGSEYVISDIYGRRCITGTATETLQFISVSNQASGVYIFNARTSNGKAYTRQFVISR